MIVTLGKPRGLLLPVENPFLNFKIDGSPDFAVKKLNGDTKWIATDR